MLVYAAPNFGFLIAPTFDYSLSHSEEFDGMENDDAEYSAMALGLRFGVVVSRFNSLVTEQLLLGAADAIRRHGGEAQREARAYASSSEEDREALLAFLSGLVLYSVDDLPADLDGDGRMEIIVLTPAVVHVFKGDGSQVWQHPLGLAPDQGTPGQTSEVSETSEVFANSFKTCGVPQASASPFSSLPTSINAILG